MKYYYLILAVIWVRLKGLVVMGRTGYSRLASLKDLGQRCGQDLTASQLRAKDLGFIDGRLHCTIFFLLLF